MTVMNLNYSLIINCDLIDQSTDSRDIELHEGSVNPGYIDSHGDGNIDTSRRNTGECETEVKNQAELTKLKKSLASKIVRN